MMIELVLRNVLRGAGISDDEINNQLRFLFSDSSTMDELNIKQLARLKVYVLCGVQFNA